MLKNYIKIAIKVLLRHKLFTFISLFGISFTLMILIIIVSLVDHTFGKMAPETRLDRTLSATYFKFSHTDKHSSSNGPIMSYYFFHKYAKTLEIPKKVSISSFHKNVETYKENKKFKMALKYCDAEFWEILDFTFLEGQPFNLTDVENINPVAVITRNVKEKYFNDEFCLGENMMIDGINYIILGVVENISILRPLPYSDIWVPITNINEDLLEPRLEAVSFPSYFALALAEKPADLPLIKEEFQNKITQMEFFNDMFNQLEGGFETYFETIAGVLFGRSSDGGANTSGLLVTILITMILFMLLPTINLVNINISRIMERSTEIGIRKAFGASSVTLVGQFMIENIIITLIGGFLALIFSIVILHIINQAHVLRHVTLAINWRIFYKSLLICLFFSLFSGVWPAFKMSRFQPVEALRGGQS
ncbi:MAG: ABC transporter permease [Candidatus Marinimicrobia bacterium]|nr:ABC transporter permease [Candidatus Neomarinimicrobiota bacterium]